MKLDLDGLDGLLRAPRRREVFHPPTLRGLGGPAIFPADLDSTTRAVPPVSLPPPHAVVPPSASVFADDNEPTRISSPRRRSPRWAWALAAAAVVLLGWRAWPSPRPTAVAAPRPAAPPPPSPAVSRFLDAPAVQAEPPPASGTGAPLLAPLRYRVAGAMPEEVDAAALRAFAEDLERRCRGRRILLTGHTCNIGAPRQNITLGRERARYARQLLVAAGVDEAIEVRSAGSRAPLVSNRSEAGRQQNRRVTASCADTSSDER